MDIYSVGIFVENKQNEFSNSTKGLIYENASYCCESCKTPSKAV